MGVGGSEGREGGPTRARAGAERCQGRMGTAREWSWCGRQGQGTGAGQARPWESPSGHQEPFSGVWRTTGVARSAHGCLTALWPLLRPSGRGFGGVGLKWCPVSRRSGRQLCRNPAGPASDTRRRCLGDAVAGSAREQPKQPLRRGGVPGRGHGRTRAPVAGHYRWT